MGSKFLFLVLLATMVGNQSFASTKCEPLIKDLQSMQQAQGTLLKSLSQKNESLARTLDQFGKNYETLVAQKKVMRKVDVIGLKISAKAFREHGAREEQLIKRFETASQELITQVESCLSDSSSNKIAQQKN